ncbi:MAG TPA: bifunctional 5,10-methylenetetrahydrofolate dehydrogenase/5,10-methenyltetrahydrofolate cyclohydrolase, partial [Candidatus Cloacimonetes bacterium]|nr:bifunctional 5,10-methylenetetrahydrofolate dehydrogenase/5,10-methenyltetrahydrofolate cyclohydrolase [Candidatus Cloacimonadota bacterium]
PLPEQFDKNKVVIQIDPAKDIDGLHPVNVGRLVLGQKCFIPSTPSAVMELLKYYKIPTEGARIVIIGRSAIVGLPLLNLLVQKKDSANATVTLCHSRSKNIQEISKNADILIIAIGKSRFVDHTYISSRSIVIDVGINEIYDTDTKTNIYVGDVFYQDVLSTVQAITPVPGGIGTITTASLLKNVVEASWI